MMRGVSVMLSVPPEGQEKIPELCEPSEWITACLSAQAGLQNHDGDNVGTLWSRSPSLTTPGRAQHPGDHMRRTKDLDEKGGPTPCSVALIVVGDRIPIRTSMC